ELLSNPQAGKDAFSQTYAPTVPALRWRIKMTHIPFTFEGAKWMPRPVTFSTYEHVIRRGINISLPLATAHHVRFTAYKR
ncbi:MAG: hypothetical protein Q7U42_12325, partial [Parvibaculum sp.]|nr:hypothetical protein [Parvibaculum sp.]